MSYSTCQKCGGMLEGFPGSPCMNNACEDRHSRAQRRAPVVAPFVEVAPSSGVLAARKAKRRAARAARRANR